MADNNTLISLARQLVEHLRKHEPMSVLATNTTNYVDRIEREAAEEAGLLVSYRNLCCPYTACGAELGNGPCRCATEENTKFVPFIRPIQTSNEHKQALSRVSILMDKELEAGSSDERELQLLAVAIEVYEERFTDLLKP